jgi:hypothetical protein
MTPNAVLVSLNMFIVLRKKRNEILLNDSELSKQKFIAVLLQGEKYVGKISSIQDTIYVDNTNVWKRNDYVARINRGRGLFM